jgi:hypothetical protein
MPIIAKGRKEGINENPLTKKDCNLTLGILGNSKAQQQHNDAEDMAHVPRQAEYVHTHGGAEKDDCSTNKNNERPPSLLACPLEIGGRHRSLHQWIDRHGFVFEASGSFFACFFPSINDRGVRATPQI